jgi:peroxiredoxin
MLKEGSKAPAFSVQDDHGQSVRLSAFLGKKNVVVCRQIANAPECAYGESAN